MTIFDAIILSIIEGITEFLPISSTGHMIVAGEWLGVANTDTNQAFEVIIQVAAILAVIANYKEKFHPRYFSLWVKVAVAFLPIGIIGFLMSDIVKALFSVTVVGTMFIIGGIIFILVERYYQEEKCPTTDVNDITMKQAMWVGFAQIFALVPGTSRAGATIIGGMLSGLNRKSCAEFSFLLGLPVLGAASGYDLLKHYQSFTSTDFINLGIGFITAFIVAYFVIKWFIAFLSKFTFFGFGVYRIIFGLILLSMA